MTINGLVVLIHYDQIMANLFTLLQITALWIERKGMIFEMRQL